MNQSHHLHEHPVHINRQNAVDVIKSMVEALEKDPLVVKKYISIIGELSNWGIIGDLPDVWSSVQRSLREEILYESGSGYREHVRQEVARLTKLFTAVLKDSSGERH